MDNDFLLARSISFKDALKIAADRMGFPQGQGMEKMITKSLDCDGAIKFIDQMAEGAGLSIEAGEALKEFAVKHHLLSMSTIQAKTKFNQAGSRWTVSGDGAMKIVDGNGTVIAEGPSGEGVIVLDPPADLWDDFVMCYEECAREAAIRKTQFWYSHFRLGVITGVCVVESYLNRLGHEYLTQTTTPDPSVVDELSGEGGRVSLRDKIKKWPKLFAQIHKPLDKDLWDDELIQKLDQVIRTRDAFIHEKRPVHVVKSGVEGLARLRVVATTIQNAVVRIGQAVVGVEPEWTRKHHQTVIDPLEVLRLRDEQERADEMGLPALLSEQYNRARIFVIQSKIAPDRQSRVRNLMASIYFAKGFEEVMREELLKGGGDPAASNFEKQIANVPYVTLMKGVSVAQVYKLGLLPVSDTSVAVHGPKKLRDLKATTTNQLAMRGEEVFDDQSSSWVRWTDVLEKYLVGLSKYAKELPQAIASQQSR